MSGKAVFKIDARAAARTSRAMAGAPGRIRAAVIAVFRGELAGQVHESFRNAAPFDSEERDSYHLQDHIEAPVSFGGGGVTITVRAEARSPGNGFDYLNVTRFGRGAIFASPGRWLHWQSGGQEHFAKSVGPWSPGEDWVERGQRESQDDVDQASRTLGRVLPGTVL